MFFLLLSCDLYVTYYISTSSLWCYASFISHFRVGVTFPSYNLMLARYWIWLNVTQTLVRSYMIEL